MLNGDRKKYAIFTFSLKILLAADNSTAETSPESVPNVFASLDRLEGVDTPFTFSALTRNW